MKIAFLIKIQGYNRETCGIFKVSRQKLKDILKN